MIYKRLFIPAQDIEFLPTPVRSFFREPEKWKNFFDFHPNLKQDLEARIQDFSFSQEQRELLVSVLIEQKHGNPTSQNLAKKLLNPKCFAIVTGHQPLIMGGPLFFWYKILGVIHLAKVCQSYFTEYEFIPVFWLAGEDHDLAEALTFPAQDGLQTFLEPLEHYKGAVGRLGQSYLQGCLKEIIQRYPDISAQPWFSVFERYYKNSLNLAEATLKIIDALFCSAGLLTINPDDKTLKSSFLPWFHKELTTSFVKKGLDESRLFFRKYDLKEQIQARSINIFYISENSRMPVQLADQGHFWIESEKVSLDELLQRPESLSPNVALRPVYQQQVLPCVAYIAGPSEFNYWLQLPPVFQWAGLPFPRPILRPMAAFVPQKYIHWWRNLALPSSWILLHPEKYLKTLADRELQFQKQSESHISTILEELQQLKKLISHIDTSLTKSADATTKKFAHTLVKLQKIAYKSWNRRHAGDINKLMQLYSMIFPNGQFQERELGIMNFSFLQGSNFENLFLSECEYSEGIHIYGY